MPTETPMPLYQCHKKVRALKIMAVNHPLKRIVPNEPGFKSFTVSQEYLDRHRPQAGGYFVQYEDGYVSYSPAKAFEEGYTRIDDG